MTTRTKYGTDHNKISIDYYNEIRDMTALGRKHIADKLAGQFVENIKIPATAINPPGAASDPDVEATSGLLLFDAGGTELIYAIIQLPYKWQLGSSIHPHIHWAKTTSAVGNVGWRLRYKQFPVGDVADAAWTDVGIVANTEESTPDADTADHQMITGFGEVDMAGLAPEHSILFELSRVGGDASDTYAADARLIAMDILYKVDAPGGIRDGIKQTY